MKVIINDLSKNQAIEFASWFENQGVQDMVDWFENNEIQAAYTDSERGCYSVDLESNEVNIFMTYE